MKLFIVLSVVCAMAAAQTAEGGYHFGYNDGQSSRQEEQSADGVVRGAYSFIDANGVVETVRYTADAVNGYQIVPSVPEASPVLDQSGAPLPVMDTPEVAAAKLEHFEAVRRASGLPLVISVPSSGAAFDLNGLPLPVVDTPEVAAAKQEHFEAVRRANGFPVQNYVPGVVSSVPSSGAFDFNGLPLPVVDTPEVAAAKQEHFAAVRRANGFPVQHYVPGVVSSVPSAGAFDFNGVPLPVTDTPEVAAAKYAHFQAYRQF